MLLSRFFHFIRSGKVPLKLVFVVPFVLQIVLAVGVTYWIASQSGRRDVNQVASHLRREISDRTQHELTHSVSVVRQSHQLTVRLIESNILNPNDFRQLEQFFWHQTRVFNIDYINFANPEGQFIGVGWVDGQIRIEEQLPGQPLRTYAVDQHGHRKALVKQAKVNVSNSPWYTDALLAGRPVWSKLYQWPDNPKVWAVSSSYPLYDRSDRRVGVIGIDILLSRVNQFLQRLTVSPGGQVFILDRQGSLVGTSRSLVTTAHPTAGIAAAQSPDPLLRATVAGLNQQFGNLLSIRAPQQISFWLDGQRQYVQVTPWRDEYGLDWLILVVIPESDFLSALNSNTRTTILLCGAFLLLAIAVGWITSHWLVRRIQRISQVAHALAQGDWQQKIPDSQFQELTYLAQAFNQMGSQLQESFRQLEYNAYHDPLTGLLNHAAFTTHLKHAIARSHVPVVHALGKSSQRFLAVLFLDLDDFKLVNDSLGHLAGDQLLIAVADRLRHCLRPGDAIARFGGDEFVILLDQLTRTNDAIEIATQILQKLQRPFHLSGNEVFITTSIGIVFSTLGGEDPERLIRNADIALYRAKTHGKAGYEVFDIAMHTETVKRLQLETDLRHALDREEFEVYYQPIIDTCTHQISGFEALLRWHHPNQGMVPPGQFIPVAEETGLIVPLGWWTLQQACAQMKHWQRQFSTCRSAIMSVNLSGKQFLQTDLLEQIDWILLETGLAHRSLKLEITESLLMNHEEMTRSKLKRLSDSGIQLSLDDFGTGYSSLSYLHRFEIDTLKIDRSFVSRLGANGENAEIIEAIVVLAHKLGMDIIAEGVETSQQLHYLHQLGCEQIQGYLFSPPLPPSQITKLLSAHTPIKIALT